MLDFLGSLFDASGFPARWRCGAWTPLHGWLHILSDLGVWSAYMAIPAVLGFFVARKKDVPFRGILLLFTAFILACGTTHLMEAVIFWWPAYRLAGVLKLATAVVSWVTVIALVRVTPRMLAMRAPEELEREVAARRAAEAGLHRANADLEERVRERTDQLRRANADLFAERERFRTTLSSIGDAVIATDTAGRVTFLNPVAEVLTGWSADGAAGEALRSVFHIVNETTRNEVENPADRALRNGAIVGLANHTVLIGRDGREHPIDDSAAPIRDAAGGVAGAVLVFRDITERQRTENQVRASEERYRHLFEANPHPMWVFDRETLGFLAVNDAAVAKYGHSRDEFLARTLKDIRPDQDVPTLLAKIAADTDGFDDAGVWRHRLKDGRVIRVRIASHTLTFDGRRAEVVLAQDVTDQLRAEAERAELLARLDLQIERLPLAYLLSGPDFRYTRWNPAAERTFGFDQTEVLGRHPFDVVVPEPSRPLVADVFARLAAGDMNAHGTCENVTKDGRTIVCEWHNTPLLGPDGTFLGVLSLAQDVTARTRAEGELRLRDRAIQAVTGGIVIADATRPDNPVIYSSAGFERLTGYAGAEVLGWNCRFLQGPRTDAEALAHVREAVRDARPCDVELLNYRKDGTTFWNHLQLSPVRDDAGRLTHYIGVQSDVTERRKLENQVRQAQKLEAIGQLAGGVAHDFNNLLTVVNGCGELLLAELAADAPTRPLAEDIIRAGQRGAALTRQLLAFSRQQMLRVEVFDPNEVLLDTAKLLTRLLGEDVALNTVLDPAAGFVEGDIGQIEQVVINLAVNGRDAMPRGGALTLETAPVDVADNDLPNSPDARPGRYFLLTVTDAGTGMPPDVQARLFEPFFTTKPAGKGTGLGLATVYGIVRQSGGFLSVRSEVGKGTTVAVYLPRHEEERSAGSKSALRAVPRATAAETILVVEDDEAVRALTTAVLVRQGYRVESAESGADALAACDRSPTPPDLVLTDVVMPGMSGRELAEALTARFPRLKVVFLSGYTADAVLRHGIEEERLTFLQKPYTADGLTRFVREVLDGTADDPA